MSNADTYAIAFDENDPTKEIINDRKIPTYFTWWHNDLYTRKKNTIRYQYMVEDDIFDLSNWKDID